MAALVAFAASRLQHSAWFQARHGDRTNVQTQHREAGDNPRLVARLTRMQSYMASRHPDLAIRDQIVDAELAEIIGKDGRVVVSHILDYAEELFTGTRPRRSTRDKFFAELATLNAILDHENAGYYIFGGVHWNDDSESLERVTLDVYRITGKHRYRSDDGKIWTVLQVTRLEGSDLAGDRLGFTSAGHHESLVLPAKVRQELDAGLIPARHAHMHTPLFEVAERDAQSDWYQGLRATLAEVLAVDLATMTQDPVQPAAAIDRLVRAVDLHEVQHLLDFEHDRERHARAGKVAARPLEGPFLRLTEIGADKALAYGALYETSAHLAQMARDSATARVTLSVVTSYAFTDACNFADCLAALVVLDELAIASGQASSPWLITGRSYALSDIAAAYVALARLDRETLARAAGTAWQRLFGEELVPLTDF